MSNDTKRYQDRQKFIAEAARSKESEQRDDRLKRWRREMEEHRGRPATLAECLVVLKARLSDHLSPAEKRELQQAAESLADLDRRKA